MLHAISTVVLAAGVLFEPTRPAVTEDPATVVTVVAKDYAFIPPKTAKSGTITFRLVNEGKELHHLTIIKLATGKTAADYMKAVQADQKPPAWAEDVGGPNAAIPGSTIESTITLEAGEYALVCWIPSPGEQAPHAMKGMVGSLTVLSDRSAGKEPVADLEIRLTDYKFNLSKPLTAGKHVIRVVNDADQPHEVVFVQLAPGKSLADFGAWAETGMKGPPPGKPIEGSANLAKGRSAYFPANLTPGTYGMLCFAMDAKDGKPHTEHGMVQEFVVLGK